MAWSHISIIYGVVLTFEELRIIFNKIDLPDEEDEDFPFSFFDIFRTFFTENGPEYNYNYKYNRVDRYSGQRIEKQYSISDWLHNYTCCSELQDKCVVIGRVVGDIESEQFLNNDNIEYLPIWDTNLTLDKLMDNNPVDAKPTDYNLDQETKKQVQEFLNSLGVDKEPQLFVMADDCYSCI